MARPHLTLEKWLSIETEVKKEFLEQEWKLGSGQIRKIPISDQKDCYQSTNHSRTILNDQQAFFSGHKQSSSDHINQLFQNPLKFETENFLVETNDEHFEILKKRYRIFKYNYKNKKAKRVTKQITLDQKTLKELDNLTKKHKLKSLQNCLDFLIDQHNFKLIEKDRIISKLQKSLISNNDSQLKQELKLKDEEINRLKTELGQQKHTIQENMRLSAKEFEDYLIQTAVSKTIELEKIKAFLGDISEVDRHSINGALAPEETNEIKDQFLKNCTEQKQFLRMKNQSNLNEDLGFDQHANFHKE